MFVRIEKLLNEQHLALIDELIESCPWTDGAATTGGPTKALKHNLQLDLADAPRRDEFFQAIAQLINSHTVLRAMIWPRRMATSYDLAANQQVHKRYALRLAYR